MNQHRAVELNLKAAVESLSMSPEEKIPTQDISVLKQVAKPSLKRSVSMPDTELQKKPSLLRRAATSIDNFSRYDDISTLIAPFEKALMVALKRFPVPVAPKAVSADASRTSDQDSEQDSEQADEAYSKLPFAQGTKSPRSVGRVYDCTVDPPPHLLEYLLPNV